ncbi:hypothetical protein K3495_g10040 [Podosphaera aphanis]|nr:hypothetical protein K3495_g10040 [Podosphaera aphanis]
MGAILTNDPCEKETISLVVEFTGGLEILFNDQRKHSLTLPARTTQGGKITLGWLIQYLRQNLLTDSREEMFVLDDRVRPGILVLVNDADWELEEEAAYVLQPNDNILFVSTLHGG